jgi:Na+/H+ antiporter NhaA
MLGVILPPAMIYHLNVSGQIGPHGFRTGMIFTALWTGCVTLLATTIPLALGVRTLERRDF